MKEFTEIEPLIAWLTDEHMDIVRDHSDEYIVLRWSTKRIDIWGDLKFQLSGSVVNQRGRADRVTAGPISEMINMDDYLDSTTPEEVLIRFHTPHGEYSLSFL